MPTKPIVQPEAWATNALYTTGPFIGSASKVVPGVGIAAEGHRPGSLFPTPAEYENSQQNRITELCRWLFLGTSSPDPDAHVVETNASGYAGLFGLDIVNTVDGPAALTVSSVNTLIPAATIECLTGASGLQVNIGTAGATAIEGDTFAGMGTCVAAVMSGTIAGGAGLRATADAATTADALVIDHAGTGRGAVITHAGTSGVALRVSGNSGDAAIEASSSGNQSAIIGTGSGLGIGVIGVSSGTAGSVGVYGVLGNNTGVGVYGITPVGATTAASALFGEAFGNGAGVRGTGATHAGGVFSSTNAAGVALYLPGKAADPTNVFDGRADYNTTTRTWVVSDSTDIAYRDVWTSRGGAVLGQTSGDSATTAGGAAWITLSTLNLTGSNAPHRAGVTLVLRFMGTARSVAGAGATNTLNVRIRDTTAGATLVTYAGAGGGAGAGFYMPATPATFDWTTTIGFDVSYSIPAAGNRTFVVEIQTGAANNIQVGRASLIPFGCFV